MENKSMIKTFLSFLWPSVMGMIIISAYTFTDTFVVGYALGRVGLSAIGIGTPVILAFIALGYLFGEGGGAAYSVLMGEGNKQKAKGIFTQSVLVAIIIGILLMIIGNVFIVQLSTVLGATKENLPHVIDYVKFILWFGPIIILNMAVNTFMRNDGKPKIAMLSTAVGSISNIILDILFVMFLNMGMLGASVATGLGNTIGLAVNLIYIYCKKRNIRLSKTAIKIDDVMRILKNGFGPFFMEFSVALITFLYNIIAFKYYGEIGISSYTIIVNWHLIGLNMIVGVAQGSQPLISLNCGKGNKLAVKTYRKYGTLSCLAIGTIALFTWMFASVPLSEVFIEKDIPLLNLTAQALKITSATYVFLAITIMLSYFYAATEKGKQSMIINLCRGLVMPAILVFIMPIMIGKVGVWVSIPVAEALSSLVAIVLLIATIKGERKIKLPTEVCDCNNVIITISRQFGSGGREIGKKVAERLNIPCYDKQLNEFSADMLGINSDVVKEQEEESDGFKYGMYIKGHYSPISNKIFLAQSKLIKQFANKSNCVIVGRCADYVLTSYNTINVFINAPLKYRIERVKSYENISEKQANSMIIESDKARKEYHNFYASTKWGNANNYDLTINSEIGIDRVVDLICELYNAKVNN